MTPCTVLFFLEQPVTDDQNTLALSQIISLNESVPAFDPLCRELNVSAERQPGQVIDQKYRIIRLLGEGGMGAVYQAQHIMLGRDVALKTFRSPHLSQDAWARFQREAQAIARMSHPNIVQVFDFGIAEDQIPYYTMECLSGESLADLLEREEILSPERCADIFLQLCHGMSLAHSKGIIHRDLKPGNIFIVRTGESGSETIKVLDFGLATLALEGLEAQKLTSAGTVFGSPLYMSPEQGLGLEVTRASDIYSCGCAIFEALTGRPPFCGKNALDTLMRHQQETIPKLVSQAGQSPFPLRLVALVERMLAKNPADRMQSFEAVAAELQTIGRARTTCAAEVGHLSDVGLPSRADAKGESSEPAANSIKVVVPFAVLAGSLAIAVGAILFWPRSLQPPVRPLADKAPVSRVVSSPASSEEPAPPPLPMKKFLQNSPIQPHKVRIYSFPYPTSVGTLKWTVDAHDTPVEHEAKGEVVVPADAWVEFTADHQFAYQPELFDGFGKEELDMVVLRPNMAANWRKALKQICCKDRLSQLVLNDLSDINDDMIEDIDRLPNLRVLYVDSTDITGYGLSRLKRLPRFTYLSARGCTPIRPVLDKLRNSKAILGLYLAKTQLSDDDLSAIATMPNLVDIGIGENPKISDVGLAKLARLTELRMLHIRNTGVSPACIDVFRKMHRLKGLEIEDEVWSNEKQAELKRVLRGCKFIRRQDMPNRIE
jgi:serine/threonine protein kinase